MMQGSEKFVRLLWRVYEEWDLNKVLSAELLRDIQRALGLPVAGDYACGEGESEEGEVLRLLREIRAKL